MSLSGALNNAITGLTASSRSAEVVSNNVANALTDGYATRQVLLSSRAYGNGVQVNGVQRNWDPILLGDRRIAQAGQANSDLQFAALQRIEAQIGEPSEPGSLSARLAALDGALIEANSRPESEARLNNVVRAAQSLTETFNRISDSFQTERMNADRAIGTTVADLNKSLGKVQELNEAILRFTMTGNDTNSLIDQRQMVIDSIAEIVPVKQIERDFGRVALFTPGGAVLIDGPPAEIGFEPRGMIVAEMSLASGALSGLTLNGREQRLSGPYSPFAGGSLAGLIAIRDEIVPKAQVGLDSLARNMIDRFANPALDPTMSGGVDPGLFTDAGNVLDPLTEVGLAERISVNASVVPEEGGESWRIRDGIYATTAGNAGDGRLISGLIDALNANSFPSSGPMMSISHTSESLFGTYLSLVTSDRLNSEQDQLFNTTRFQTLKAQELKNGVDTDDEMQKLLLVERAYSANARVVSTIDQLLDELLRM